MVDGVDKIRSFEDMTVWQESVDLAVLAYKLTKHFPKDEQFTLTSQIRRAVTSISANLAEGFGRYGQKEKAQFYKISYGSLLEVKSFLLLSEKLDYCDHKAIEPIIKQIVILQKRINSLISTIKSR
jgi:four helix bundle protein